MAEVVPLESPDLMSPELNDSLSSSTPPNERSLLDVSQSFNIDYLTMKHDEEIASIRANLLPSPSSPFSAAASPRRPQSASAGGRGKGDSHRLLLLAAEKSLLEDRVRMMERLLSKQNVEMEEYVTSTASLYVKLSDAQQQLTTLSHQRDALETEAASLRSQSDSLQKDNGRVHVERDRERESSERHVAALKRELADVRSRWVECQAHNDRLSDEYQQHEEQYSRRIDELERQRERWEKADRLALELQARVDDLRRDNEKLKEEAVRVGQLTAEVNGMHEVVERIYAERKTYEDERAQWSQDRREADRRERDLKDALMTAQLEAEKSKREADALRREADDTHQRHQREVADLEQRRVQDREEAARQSKLLKGEVRALRDQLHRMQEAQDRLAHPDHEELIALRGQWMQAKDECAQLKDRLHDEDLARLTTQQQMKAQQQRVEQLTAQRNRLIHRIQNRAHQQTVAHSFYQWSSRIQVKRVERRAEEAMKRVAEERKEAEVEERKREKAEVDRTLKELEDKMRRLENERLREEEQRRNSDEQRRHREENASEDERRRERERQERHRQRARNAEADQLERQRKDREEEERGRRRREAEDDGRQRSPSPQRHHHRHYVSPSTSPAAAPLPFPYHPALSVLLALTPSSSSPEDVQLAGRMQNLLEKLRTLQQMKEGKAEGSTQSQPGWMAADESGGAVERSATNLPTALLAPPMKPELLPRPIALPAESVSWKRGKENLPVFQSRRTVGAASIKNSSALAAASHTAKGSSSIKSAISSREVTVGSSRSRSSKKEGSGSHPRSSAPGFKASGTGTRGRDAVE